MPPSPVPSLLLARAWASATAWTWAQNGLRLGGGLVTLALLVRFLPKAELGMFYVFLALTAFLWVLDGAVSANLSRYLSYALGGADALRPTGMAPPRPGAAPNWPLVGELLGAIAWLYRRFAGLCGLLLLAAGTPMIWPLLPQTGSAAWSATAWAATVAAAAVDVQASASLTALRGLDRVRDAAQIATLSLALRPVLLALFLIADAGLLALPAATLLTAGLAMFTGRRRLAGWLRDATTMAGPARPAASRALLAVLWPNTWRVGVKLLSLYLANLALVHFCTRRLGLSGVAAYGLTVQLGNLAHGFASAWTLVKLPAAAQLRAAGRVADLRRLLWPRVWLQDLSFVAAAAGIVFAGPWLLRTLGTDQELLPQPWLLVFLVNGFLWMGFSFWTFLITTENRVPSLWPTVATSGVTILLAGGLLHGTELGLGALVLAPLLAGLAFNYWYWPASGARSLGTSRLRYFLTPQPPRE
ncbi:MAG TPA: hypothetical protein PKE47_07530 [Verrucomicrobiota bacterium]|nr:hypothetical protein [Verrucomicrobiota bacterium]